MIVVAVLLLVAALVLLALFSKSAAADSGAKAQILADGLQEYQENCQSCHGADLAGGGPLSAKLVKPPKDLTDISKANGGRYPFWRVFAIISGESAVSGHDTHQMPDFYASLKKQEGRPGFLPAHVRILELTHYLESVQK